MGKHRPTYTPHIDTGDYVIVTNVDKVVFTGNKWQQKSYQRYSGYPGGQRDEAAWKLFQRRPERILELAIQRMMPKSKIGRHMMDKLKLYVGPNHPHQAQQPDPARGPLGPPRPGRRPLRPAPGAERPRKRSRQGHGGSRSPRPRRSRRPTSTAMRPPPSEHEPVARAAPLDARPRACPEPGGRVAPGGRKP